MLDTSHLWSNRYSSRMVVKSFFQKFGFDEQNYYAIFDYKAPAHYSICRKYRDSLYVYCINDALIRHDNYMLFRIYYRHRK